MSQPPRSIEVKVQKKNDAMKKFTETVNARQAFSSPRIGEMRELSR